MDRTLASRSVEPTWRRPPVLLFALVVVLCLSWEGAVRNGLLNEQYYATPSAAVARLMADLPNSGGGMDRNADRPLIQHVGITLMRWLSGFLIASALGVAIGFGIAGSRLGYGLGMPVVNFLRALPSAAVWPIAAVATAFSPKGQTIVIVFGSLWPVVLNTVTAIRGLHQEVRDTIQFMHLGRLQRAWVVLQLAAPGIFTGIEVACSIAFLLSVTVEMLWPSEGGIGWYLTNHQNQGDPVPLFAGVLLTASVGWLLNSSVQWVRKVLLFWESGTEDAGQWISEIVRFVSPGRGLAHVLESARDPRIEALLRSSAVTDTIRQQFGACSLRVLSSAPPCFEPTELSRIMSPGEVAVIRQRDVILDAGVESAPRPVLFAQSWINEVRLSGASALALDAGVLTIGEIVRTHESDVRNIDLSFRSVISEDVGRLLQQPGAVRAVERRRLLAIGGEACILIHEYYPVVVQ